MANDAGALGRTTADFGPGPALSEPSHAPPPSHREGLAYPWLLADVGGTNARFAWVAHEHAPTAHTVTLPVAAFADLASAARCYLDELAQRLNSDFRPPRAAALAVATAVLGDRVEWTNSGWSFSRQALAAELGLASLQVLNDFEALALALPHLSASQWLPVGALAPVVTEPRAALAVIGPGTGLGVAGLVPHGRGWLAVPGEGGHASLAPADDFESGLLAVVRRQFSHVSAERLLSGIGLPTLHQAVVAVMGAAAPVLEADQIVQRGVEGTDPLCAATLSHFCALLGSFAGNVALTLGARGGVYIGGGIVPRLGEVFLASRFRERFEAKGRFRSYLQQVPTALITDTQVALLGARAALQSSIGDEI